MSKNRTQILFTPKAEKMSKDGLNWYNITLDVTEYLKEKGFEYSRTLGFVNDRELSEEELMEMAKYISENIIDLKYFSYFNASIIGDTMSIKGWLNKEGADK